MATNYAGDPAATEAPSAPPTPGAVPTVVIPSDGEPLNAASITQSNKALADFVAWLLSPRAKASDWAVPLQLWRDGALHRRFGIDHLGYPMGRLQLWRANWEFSADVIGVGGAGVTSLTDAASGWNLTAFKAAGGTSELFVRGPNSQFPGSRTVRIQAGNSSGDYAFVTRWSPVIFNANLNIAMEWEVKINTLENYGYGMGWCDNISFRSGGHAAKALFYNLAGSGNWRCHTDDGTTLNDQDSGVAISAANTVRFRLEYHGAAVDDAGTQRVLFFINGVLVGNLTANMPSAAADPACYPLFALVNTGGSAGQMDLGPVVWANNLWTDAF